MNNAETMKHARAALGKSAAEVALDATVERLGNALVGLPMSEFLASVAHDLDVCASSDTLNVPEVCATLAMELRERAKLEAAKEAAAPDLLAALRLAESSLSTYAKTGAFTAGQPSGWLLRQLSAAIARAEGGAQ